MGETTTMLGSLISFLRLPNEVSYAINRKQCIEDEMTLEMYMLILLLFTLGLV